ncbi:MAG: hypothetical protein JSV09_01485 [Thermoplasmata archaeon]|nr:MAG: hypothetical protein JSV09_01485 [Thermoplasmata archaeon]
MRRKIVIALICVLFMISSMTLTTTTFADWDPPDGHKMHWPQTPDLSDTGMAVEMHMMQFRADDFQCSETGYITDIHIWGSFEKDIVPTAGPGGLIFHLSIWSDIPAYTPGVPPLNWSRPGTLLWQMSFGPGGYSVINVASGTDHAWWDPETPDYDPINHDEVYQYNFHIDTSQAFLQQNGTIYWLAIRLYVTTPGTFGWKTTTATNQFNDNAVRVDSVFGWAPLVYPSDHDYAGHPVDFAFVINGVPPPPTVTLAPYPLTPVTLNLASKGRWITARIDPYKGYEAEDIVLERVMLEDSIPADWGQVTGSQLMLKFDRGDLEDMIGGGDPHGKPAEFKISGRFTDGTPFEGLSETVKVIDPGK